MQMHNIADPKNAQEVHERVMTGLKKAGIDEIPGADAETLAKGAVPHLQQAVAKSQTTGRGR